MKPYKNLSGDSGVHAYELGPDFIAIRFVGSSSTTYWYTFARPGAAHVIRMKELAQEGRGLAEYIAKRPAVRDGFDRKA